MPTLSELYITMENLRKLNLPIDERLKQEAAKLEEDLIRTEILPTLTEKIETALAQVQRELVLVVDYVPGAPLKVSLSRIKVSLSRKRNITDVLPDAVEIKPDPVVEHSEKKKGDKRVVLNPPTRLRITMPDGSIIEERTAWESLYKFVHIVGVGKVRAVGLIANKIPLVSNTIDKKFKRAQKPLSNG